MENSYPLKMGMETLKLPSEKKSTQVIYRFILEKDNPFTEVVKFWGETPPVKNGEGGIRTLDRVAPIQHFQCCALNHSATSPSLYRDLKLYNRTSIFCTP